MQKYFRKAFAIIKRQRYHIRVNLKNKKGHKTMRPLHKKKPTINYSQAIRLVLILFLGGNFIYQLTYVWWQNYIVRAIVAIVLLYLIISALDKPNN